jgi:Protein of unknown function (DUF3160)
VNVQFKGWDGCGVWLAALLLLIVVVAQPMALTAQSPVTGGGLASVGLSSFYQYQPIPVIPNALPSPLPVNWNAVSNAALVAGALPLDAQARQAIERNGFVVIPNGQEVDMVNAYSRLAGMHVPNFITADSVLHLYHVQFDQILSAVETNEFFPDLKALSHALFNSATNEYATLSGDLGEAARRNVAFFSVGLELLGETVTVPDYVADTVSQELNLIQGHAGFAPSPLFVYPTDYSQFVPRGHYTRSADLQRYFLGTMWDGQMAFLLKGSDVPGEALVSVADARIQTLEAALIALDLDRLQTGGRQTADLWNRIYGVTAFFVGLADDLTPIDYKNALGQVFGSPVDVSALADPGNFLALRIALASLPSPQIYGGTGDVIVPPNATAADLDNVLDKTKGMRLMGQRFIPDSYMFQHLVFPAVQRYTGNGNPFTLVVSQAGPIRGFPRALDVMTVLGSDRALDILDREGDTEFTAYDQTLNSLIVLFHSFGQADWTRNLYWGWLYGLQPLLGASGTGYPAFMQTAVWRDKELATTLASWTELRHDTILYAKQSGTPVTTVVTPDLTDRGYVEPTPELFNRLQALTRMTRTGLSALNVLDSTQTIRLSLLEDVLGHLTAIAVGELEGHGPTASDGSYISQFPQTLAPLVQGLSDSQAGQTALVADVHTDGNTGQVLEEGVGYVKLLVGAYPLPEGRMVLGAGPVFSYYEFKSPMNNRLTDEQWTNLLASANPPTAPAWTGSFTYPVTLPSEENPGGTNLLRLLDPSPGAGGVSLQWQSAPTNRYRVFYSDDLITWLLLSTPVTAGQATTGLIDPGASPVSRRFYRVELVR